jgi:hypothetical protein
VPLVLATRCMVRERSLSAAGRNSLPLGKNRRALRHAGSGGQIGCGSSLNFWNAGCEPASALPKLSENGTYQRLYSNWSGSPQEGLT